MKKKDGIICYDLTYFNWLVQQMQIHGIDSSNYVYISHKKSLRGMRFDRVFDLCWHAEVEIDSSMYNIYYDNVTEIFRVMGFPLEFIVEEGVIDSKRTIEDNVNESAHFAEEKIEKIFNNFKLKDKVIERIEKGKAGSRLSQNFMNIIIDI